MRAFSIEMAFGVFTRHLEYCHELTKEGYCQYSSTRAAWDDDMVETVDLLRKHGAKKKNIRRFIAENSSLEPTLKDIANLMVKQKKQEKGLQDTS